MVSYLSKTAGRCRAKEMKRVMISLVVFMFAAFAALSVLKQIYPKRVLLLPQNVLASSYGDFDGDGKPEWVSLHRVYVKSGYIPGESCGDIVYVTEKRYGFAEYSVKCDLSDIMPSDIKTGDVDGDGIPEISVVVYKTAELHPIFAKRPFFYNLKPDRLDALWLGSRLSRRFLDYVIADVSGNGVCGLYAAEYLPDGKMLVQAYEWSGFGFTGTFASESYDEIFSIRADSQGIVIETNTGTVYPLLR